jgi:hypothetical protein
MGHFNGKITIINGKIANFNGKITINGPCSSSQTVVYIILYLSGTSSWQHPRLGRPRSKHRHRPQPGVEICQGENKVRCLEDCFFVVFFDGVFSPDIFSHVFFVEKKMPHV